jgi:hypothetical protein
LKLPVTVLPTLAPVGGLSVLAALPFIRVGAIIRSCHLLIHLSFRLSAVRDWNWQNDYSRQTSELPHFGAETKFSTQVVEASIAFLDENLVHISHDSLMVV